ncbi:MAG: DAK2 domain-containing protein [Lachnospiraceae bacterium]|nr:DAK2 domain-containing protein [Lachnospiraceae bacterium]
MEIQNIDGVLFTKLIRAGAANLSAHTEEVNDLNVFPIPDGDTGSNMLLTIQGGANVVSSGDEGVGAVSRRAADGMLLSARGNSGVILSQFFDGIATGFDGKETANEKDTADAFLCGVDHAYNAVVDPVEGTILTVVREASEYAANRTHKDVAGYMSDFLYQAGESLRLTPEKLPVLKKAGVVDSGAAGLIYIIEGIVAALNNDAPQTKETPVSAPATTTENALDLDRFNEDSELTFGYCTELLLRLQRAKTDLETFDVDVIKDYLKTVGDSIVCFRTGSIVKIHVHTKTPYMVLEFCQRYGEYLTVKIENMSLQHNSLPADSKLTQKPERKDFAVVAVASGEGIKQTFREMGADCIVEGGQSMNPSAEDFLEAFARVNADVVFVLPNNGNVILAAKQAAKLYKDSEIRVIDSRSIGDCYAILTMLDLDSGDANEIENEMNDAMNGVVTACVSKCIRDAEMDGFLLHDGQYIGITGKEIISADNDRRDTACMLADKLDFSDHEICIIVRGDDSDEQEAEEIATHIRKAHPGCEVFAIDGGQEIYSYILIVE